MKYLSDYTEQGITDLLNKNGAFYAFGSKQFDEAKKDGIEYVNCGHGLICPKENAKELIEGLIKNGDAAVLQDMQENGKENIIKRELVNHEAYYTGDIDSTVDALSIYPITTEEILNVYRAERLKQRVTDEAL